MSALAPGVADVSVIVPSYNPGDRLARALRSVQAQTVRPREIIVVDDGSTDGTPARLAAMFPDVRCEVQRNQGAAAARNHGVRLATSTFVGFVDADDEWAPRKLERQLAVFAAQPAIGLLACLMVFAGPDTRVDEAPPRPDRQVGELRYADLLAGAGGYFVSASYLLRRAVFLEVGGFDERLRSGHDTEFFLRLMHRGHSFRVLHEPLYVWHLDAGSLSGGGVSPRRAVNIVTALRGQPHPADRLQGVSLVSDAEYEGAVTAAIRAAAVAHGNAGQWEGASQWFDALGERVSGPRRLGAQLTARFPARAFAVRGRLRGAWAKLRRR